MGNADSIVIHFHSLKKSGPGKTDASQYLSFLSRRSSISYFLFFMTFIIWAIIRMLRIGRRRKEIRYLILLFVAYAIQANISGDLWNCSALLCALGYGFALSGAEQPVKK